MHRFHHPFPTLSSSFSHARPVFALLPGPSLPWHLWTSVGPRSGLSHHSLLSQMTLDLPCLARSISACLVSSCSRGPQQPPAIRHMLSTIELSL